jgi:ribosomal protein S18 acetylase RimI-like enzyme
MTEAKYLTSAREITAADLTGGFFEGWPNPPSPEAHLRILRGSSHVVLARDVATGQIVGYINAVSDGFYTAYIPQLEVLPAYRHQGIGSELVRRMLAQLAGFYAVDLLCEADLQPFYERMGLTRTAGMLRRDYTRQSGAC